MKQCDTAIIGAGPYALSIAAHLRALRINFRIFGYPMQMWLAHMPMGMRLKSEGFASSIYDPDSEFTLEHYCKENKVPYANIGLPVPLEVFAAYGLEFQRRYVPELEEKLVDLLQQVTAGFRLRLEDGECLIARRVVMAIGLIHFEYVPPMLVSLTEEFVTHSSRHRTLEQFGGREVVVVGAGASALDLAALLHQAGAHVQVIARKPSVHFHSPPEKLEPSLLDQLHRPLTGIGPGWKLFLCANAPLLFRQMPMEFRLEKVKRLLGPAPGWFIKEQVVGNVPINVGLTITNAAVQNGRVRLQLTDGAGARELLVTDHVIAATGYRVDLRRLKFMDKCLRENVRSVEHTPILSSRFESSVPGLYFVGASAANTFGPLLRFAYGARFTARRLSRHLAKSAVRNSTLSASSAKVEVENSGEIAAP